MNGLNVSKSKVSGSNPACDWSASQVVTPRGHGVVQGLHIRGADGRYNEDQDKNLTHKDKLSGYIQTSGQLGGALGLVVSGLLEGNLARAALGGFNSLRSTTKLVSDFNAKSNVKSHRNDMVEGGVATSANSVGFLNVRSPEELLAVAMGVTAWATKGISSFIHMRREQNAEKRQEEIQRNNLFFGGREVTPVPEAPKPKVVGMIHRGLEAIKDTALETTLFVMSHAPPVMMGTRAVSYLMDGINNGDLAMAGGGASFIVGATLMAFKDHKSYMKARAERKAQAEDNKEALRHKTAYDFDRAEFGTPLTASVELKETGGLKMNWGVDIGIAIKDFETRVDNINVKGLNISDDSFARA